MGDGAVRAARRLAVLLALVALVVFVRRPVARSFRAAQILTRFTGGEGWIARLGASAVDTRDVAVAIEEGTVRARRYAPRGERDAPGLVLLHGMHRLGIDEPRVVRLARAFATAGVVVLTPELVDLTTYRVDAHSVATIGASARWLARDVARVAVGVAGVSFAGGLALVAAAEPPHRDAIAFVLAIGAHHDLGRVSRFLVDDELRGPDGRLHARRADRYGLGVLVHAYAEDFFAPEDVAAARHALERSLAGDDAGARAAAERLSEAGRATWTAVLDRRRDEAPRVRDAVRRVLERREDALAAASPHGKLAGLRVPVLLLHASDDDVVPPTETEWIAREIPPKLRRRVLVSPVLGHAEMGDAGSLRDRLVLVSFLADVLGEVSAERAW